MKKLIVIFVILISQTGLAQNPPVSVISQKWYEVVEYRISQDSSPYSASQSQLPSADNFPSSIRSTGGIKTNRHFVYETVIKNETDKKIIGLAWDFVIFTPDGKTEEERQQFVFISHLRKFKKVKLEGKTVTPPARVINAKNYEEKDLKPIQLTEVKCVVFEDKTTWKRDGTDEKVCEDLRLKIRQKGKSKK
jgi:hypothetical protein